MGDPECTVTQVGIGGIVGLELEDVPKPRRSLDGGGDVSGAGRWIRRLKAGSDINAGEIVYREIGIELHPGPLADRRQEESAGSIALNGKVDRGVRARKNQAELAVLDLTVSVAVFPKAEPAPRVLYLAGEQYNVPRVRPWGVVPHVGPTALCPALAH